MTLRGETEAAYGEVNSQAWVSGIEISASGDQTIWEIAVTDAAAAEDRLLSILVSNGLKPSDFGRKEHDLEDVFLNIVERNKK